MKSKVLVRIKPGESLRTLYPADVKPALRLARTHFIRMKKDLSAS